MTKKLYIWLFIVLYISTATVSTIHAIQFFGLANNNILSIVLAITFEVGQAAVLFSLLNSEEERSKYMPWCLMCLLTAVQIMGNVFSSYKYIMEHSSEHIRYFTEPMLFFMMPNDPMVNVILTYIIGAILPIVALCLTSLVSNYLQRQFKPSVDAPKLDESSPGNSSNDDSSQLKQVILK